MSKIFGQKRVNIYNPTSAFKGLHCIDVGSFEYGPGDKVEKTSNVFKSYFTIIVVVEGRGVITFNDKTVNLKSGNVLFVPPCTGYSNVSGRENSYRYVWLSFEGDDVENYLKSKSFYEEGTPIETSNADKIYFAITKFLVENRQETVTEEKFNRLFFEILEQLTSPSLVKRNEDDYINKIISLINENYENSSFNIKVISESMHLSHSWLCALFKKKMGETMQQWLINVRLAKGKELVCDTDISINTIAFLCGFNDALYFSTSFKKAYGKSPTIYRQDCKKEQKT